MSKSLNKILLKISGYEFIQNRLDKIVKSLQYYMGIGSGSGVDKSGEFAIIDILKQQKKVDHSLCIFDVGANQGQFCKLIEEGLVGESFYIHSFEPSKFTFSALSEIIQDYSNVTINNFALGNKVGESQLFYDKPGSGLASLSKRRLDHFNIDFTKSETIQIDTIDNYCFKHKIEVIDLLKLDIEGHELDALRGAVDMFINHKIKMVTFEFGGSNIDSHTYFQDFYYFFKKHGMKKLYRITPSGYLFLIDKYTELLEQFRTTNFLVLFE